jgi:hypothetical protein
LIWGQALASALAVATAFASLSGHATPRAINQALLNLVPERWVEIQRQQVGDAVVFQRQAHGGSAFDTKRGRIVLFGSDTHGLDWTNSPLYFDIASLTWTPRLPGRRSFNLSGFQRRTSARRSRRSASVGDAHLRSGRL